MNIGKSVKNLILSSAVLTAIITSVPASAVPLLRDTVLKITPGVVTPTSCVSGSCFSMEVVPGFSVWTAITPGTDGGIVVGKNQLSGGQQTGVDSAANTTPGQATGAFSFFGNYGTFGTAPMTGTNAGVITTSSADNVFDSASCVGAACNAVTKLGSWNVAWSGNAVPMGSVGGCVSVNCTPAHLSGIFVSKWTVNPDNTYALQYSQVVPDGHPSGFGGQPFAMNLVGPIVPTVIINVPPTAGPVSISGIAGSAITWTPAVSDPDGPSPLTCFIATPPANGTATVAANCSGGSYISNATFSGTDSFSYSTSDGLASATASVTATITASTSTACTSANPIKSVTASKSNMKIVGTGNISSFSTGSSNYVFICPTTFLNYNSTSATHPGKVTCKVNDASAPVTGQAKIGDKLRCTLRPYKDQTITIYVRGTPTDTGGGDNDD